MLVAVGTLVLCGGAVQGVHDILNGLEGWARTSDNSANSRALYQLSYDPTRPLLWFRWICFDLGAPCGQTGYSAIGHPSFWFLLPASG